MKKWLLVLIIFLSIGCAGFITPELQNSQIEEARVERINFINTLEYDREVFGNRWVDVQALIEASNGYSAQLKEEASKGVLSVEMAEAFYVAGKALADRADDLLMPIYSQLSFTTQIAYRRLQADLAVLEELYLAYKEDPVLSNYEGYVTKALTIAKTLAPLILL